MDLIYKQATIEDLDLIVKERIKVLRAANKLDDEYDMSKVEKESYSYYKKGFEDNNFIYYLVYNNDNKVVACGGCSFYEVMPTCDNNSGKCAYIMNMYTDPDYRKQGIATKILDKLIKEINKRNVYRITLEATDMGRGLYKKYGFVNLRNEMEYMYKR